MASESKSLVALRRTAVILPILTLFLVFAGGLVTSKGAGLAVPDWPTSYGGFNPPNWWKIENIRAEHGHRGIAGIVGLLTIGFMVWTLMSDKAKAARRLSVLAVAAVITQAVFGGVIVLSVGDLRAKLVHATLGQAFFCITVLFAFSMRESWRREPARPLEDSGFFTLKRLALLFTAAVFIQLELGAVMRHTGSGLAIHDFPTVFGGLLPPSGEAALDQINQTRLIDLGLDRVNYPKIWIHFGHRAWAMVVFALGIWLTVRTARKEANRGELLFPAMFIGGALVLQVILGGLIVWSGKQPHIATAHVALGASILAAGVIFTAQTFRLTREDAPAGATLADPGLATPPPGTAH